MIDDGIMRAGTATVASGSRTVFGIGAPFAVLSPGSVFGAHLGLSVPIEIVTPNTLTLAFPWPGPSQTDAPYGIQIAGDPTRFAERVRLLLEQLSAGMVSASDTVRAESWLALVGIPGTRNGQPGELLDEAGTHVDPVNGATVPDKGYYRWSVTPAGWLRVGSIDDASGRVEVLERTVDRLEHALQIVIDDIEVIKKQIGRTPPDGFLIIQDDDGLATIDDDGLIYIEEAA